MNFELIINPNDIARLITEYKYNKIIFIVVNA